MFQSENIFPFKSLGVQHFLLCKFLQFFFSDFRKCSSTASKSMTGGVHDKR